MRALFNFQRTGIFWWGLVTALVFMIPEYWIFSVASVLRSIDVSVFDILKPISNEIDNATMGVLKLIQFDPGKALVFIGPYGIANLFVGIVFAIIFFGIAVVFYFRAARTKTMIDDFLAMAFLYVVMRVIGVASTQWSISVINYIHSKEPTSYLIILSIFMLVLLVRGQGFTDSEVFFKTLFEAIIIWTIIQPKSTLLLLAWIVERPAVIHQVLTENTVINKYFPMVVAVWAMLGLGIAAVNLYSAGRPPAPAGGGGGGAGGGGRAAKGE